MYAIKNKKDEVVAMVQNNIVFSTDNYIVLGILIGDCLYGRSYKMIGKIFNSTVYLLDGAIAGKVEVNQAFKLKIIKKEHMLDAWTILSGVKEHTSQWIIEKKTWSPKSLVDCLS